jgi:PAS domain S-box-containing protein
MTTKGTASTGNSSPAPGPLVNDELPALVWRVDPALGGHGFNRAWEILTGRSESDLSGEGWLEVVHPEDREALAFLHNPLSDQVPSSFDIRIRDQDGRHRWFLVQCGALVGLLRRALVALPIDERKSAESAREHELADVRAMLDNAPTMIWRTTASGDMDYANERYVKAWRQTPDLIKGWGWKNSVHPEDRDGIVSYWADHRFTDGDGAYEFRAGTPEDGYRWYLSVCTARRDEDGKVIQWHGATFDIEDRKQAEERIRRNEAFLRQGQKISKTGSVGLNLVTNEHYWSEETYRILELDQSVTPSFETFLTRVHPGDLNQVRTAFENITSSESDIDLEHRLVTPDGRVKHLRLLVNPPHAGNDGVTSFGVIMDVTASKLTEEEMYRAQADLTRVARIATMSELTASIAHEINQPISGILTNSEACLRWINRPEPDLLEAREAIERTALGARRVIEVVRQLRAIFSRQDPDPVQFDLGDLVRATLPLLRSHMNQHRASIILDLAADPLLVFADQIQIQQVLINLVMNGLQAPRGEGAERHLVIETYHDADHVTLSVTDNGMGIDENHLPNIFEPFFTTKTDGMGMGLSICRSIVESHGGRIFARGNTSGGATVGFTFPIEGSL